MLRYDLFCKGVLKLVVECFQLWHSAMKEALGALRTAIVLVLRN